MPKIILKESDVLTKLRQIDPSKASGPDGIHSRVLKECAAELAAPLTVLFQASLDTGHVPDEWKFSIVSPIFKKGSKQVAANYRPVALTAILCKLLESFVREAMVNFLMKNKFLTDTQYGFVKGRSTALQLLRYMDEVIDSLQGGSCVDAIYFDLQKAFDTVPYKRLLGKMESYGINNLVLNWCKSFLMGRKQAVSVNGSLSQPAPVASGIPQGSVLGPLLFVIYINDLPDSVRNSFLLMFADDTKLFKHITGEADVLDLQADVTELEKWSDTWLLRFHPDKCKVLTLGQFENIFFAYPYKLNNVILEHVDEEKDLGVTIDSELSFEAHMDDKINKANGILGLIRRTFTYLDKDILLTLYKALVRPHLEYANTLWKPRTKKYIKSIENVQIR